ncbi:MAG: hypothetical protein H8E26_10420 [FCB group bacterium]|nr:hypothetical protein [FCB group bacterium]MBL7027666.1 hypothetical protein [Candidatus Neomarinimicrobiota bacterium]MBL7121087.1 hypothetical protein [Candidatus Neomarinimicrobiota bacterium]
MGDRIVRNLDRVRGFLNILQDEIRDPAKSGPGGDRSEWQNHTEKLDAHLSDLRKIIIRDGQEIDS